MSFDKTILIVDDNNTNIEILLELLKDYDLLVATNGENALEIAKSEKLDLILLDIMMPKMDGYDVCNRLKSDPDTQNIPVIFITAKSDEESIEKGFDCGAVDYVGKPFKPKALIARVKTHLKINSLINNLEDLNKEVTHILNTTMEAVFVFDGDNCIDVNTEALKLFNCVMKSDVIGKNILDFANFNLFERPNSKPYETNAMKCDGTSFPALVRYEKLKLKSKDIGVFAVLDLTDIKEKEFMLNQKSKMESMGEMLTNIAHQWRQPLSVISTSASGILLQKEFGLLTDELLAELCGGIIQNSQSLSQTIDKFREVSRFDNDNKGKFYLDVLIKDIVKNFESYLDKVKIDIDIDSKLEMYSCQKCLEQIILNILKNSNDILLERGFDEKLIFVKASKVNDSITIDIYDNGGGIDKSILKKVFEPYFTTKHKSQGTGLGLYSSFNIAKNLGGTLEVENISYKYNEKKYKGAKFTIKL